MPKTNNHRVLSFVRDYSKNLGDYKEKSGFIKDGLYSWRLCDDNLTFIIQSAVENYNHSQLYNSRLLFKYESTTHISIDGYFWNIFDCEEYEWVERLYNSDYYVCRKNEKYGIIKGNGEVVIDIVYPLITRLPQIVDVDIDELYWYEPPHMRQIRKQDLGDNVKPYIVLKMSTYDGEYLLELIEMKKSKMYKKIYTFGKNYLIEEKGRFGMLSPMGVEIVPPQYTKAYPFDKTLRNISINEDYRTGGWFEVDFNGKKVPIANNGKFYGEIPLEYEECYFVGKDLINQYLVKKNGKYGLIQYNRLFHQYKETIPIEFVSIIFNEGEPFYKLRTKEGIYNFAIVQDEEGYQLYNIRARDEKIMSEHYQSLDFVSSIKNKWTYTSHSRAPFFIAKRWNKYGLISQKGKLLTDFVYQTISPMILDVFPVCLEEKWGILDEFGKEVIKCKWDQILNIERGCVTVIKDGLPRKLKLNNSNDDESENYSIFYERPTYERYAGTYAQDEMGYSDDDIDTIFDGDPDAYWNID